VKPAVAAERAAQHDVRIAVDQSRQVARVAGRLIQDRLRTQARQAAEADLDPADGNGEIPGHAGQILGPFVIPLCSALAMDVIGPGHGYSISRPS